MVHDSVFMLDVDADIIAPNMIRCQYQLLSTYHEPLVRMAHISFIPGGAGLCGSVRISGQHDPRLELSSPIGSLHNPADAACECQ